MPEGYGYAGSGNMKSGMRGKDYAKRSRKTGKDEDVLRSKGKSKLSEKYMNPTKAKKSLNSKAKGRSFGGY